MSFFIGKLWFFYVCMQLLRKLQRIPPHPFHVMNALVISMSWIIFKLIPTYTICISSEKKLQSQVIYTYIMREQLLNHETKLYIQMHTLNVKQHQYVCEGELWKRCASQFRYVKFHTMSVIITCLWGALRMVVFTWSSEIWQRRHSASNSQYYRLLACWCRSYYSRLQGSCTASRHISHPYCYHQLREVCAPPVLLIL